MRLLLVEDDFSLARGLERALLAKSYTVDAVNSGEAALFIIENTTPDLVILDIGLPDIDGLTVLARLRKTHPTLPVLILTARDAINDKVAGLDKGADDYLTKPFDIEELVARLRVFERRASTDNNNELSIGPVDLDIAAHVVRLNGHPLALSSKEYKILRVLMENSGKIMSREQLEQKLYSWGEEVSSNTVEVHIHHLRKKLGKAFIRTVRGIGYTINSS